MRRLFTAPLASSLIAAPIATASANPASSLSVASQTRAGSATQSDSELSAFGGGGGVLAAIILVGILTGIVIAATQGDDDPDSP
jgi:predicted lipid-binding transport protein (Tim44 family)